MHGRGRRADRDGFDRAAPGDRQDRRVGGRRRGRDQRHGGAERRDGARRSREDPARRRRPEPGHVPGAGVPAQLGALPRRAPARGLTAERSGRPMDDDAALADTAAALEDTLAFLTLRSDGGDGWIGDAPEWFGDILFGGFVIAQAITAATRNPPEGRRLHSLHAYFL